MPQKRLTFSPGNAAGGPSHPPQRFLPQERRIFTESKSDSALNIVIRNPYVRGESRDRMQPMNCCQCQGIEKEFNQRVAAGELKHYRQHGPAKTTQYLLEALQQQPLHGQTLLDIGGGIGAIQHALLDAGLAGATNVDASKAYLNAAREEAQRKGHIEKVRYHHGDFVALASEIDPADIVTLDRVLCCYPDMQALVDLSAARARRVYGLVFPRDRWWIKSFRVIFNLVMRLRRSPFRFFVHSTQEVDAVAAKYGLKKTLHREFFIWQMIVYTREA